MSIRNHVFANGRRCVYCATNYLDATIYDIECVMREEPLIYTTESRPAGKSVSGFRDMEENIPFAPVFGSNEENEESDWGSLEEDIEWGKKVGE